MKVFAYHHGSNGISHYRIWQPAKYLAKLPDFEIDRLPDITDRLHIPNTGYSNVPGISSHEDIASAHDLIWTTSVPMIKDTARLVAQMGMVPVVVDIDDDMLHMDYTNPAMQSWKPQLDGQVEELHKGEEHGELVKEKALKMNCTIEQRDGKFYLVKIGNDPVVNVLDQMHRAAGVTVSTERLKNLYYSYNPNIQVIPNSIDFDLWPANSRPNDGLIRLGLFGSNSHYGDWREIAEVMQRILKEFPNVRLCINPWFKAEAEQGKQFVELKSRRFQFPDYFEKLGLIDNLQVELHEPCEIQLWPKWLAAKGIDIGLAPLADTAFNLAKSNLKYLEYSTLRIPGVYEKLEPYGNDVEHGLNGFLASHPADWYSCIKRLVQNADLRRTMGNRAWLDVSQRYNQAHTVEKLVEFFKKTVSQYDPNKSKTVSFIRDRAPRPVLVTN